MTSTRTPVFLIANMASEVSRLTAALKQGDEELAVGALGRVRIIVDTLTLLPLRSSEREEIKLLQEVIEDLPTATRRFSVSAESLEDYFYPFARTVLGA